MTKNKKHMKSINDTNYNLIVTALNKLYKNWGVSDTVAKKAQQSGQKSK